MKVVNFLRIFLFHEDKFIIYPTPVVDLKIKFLVKCKYKFNPLH